MYIVVFTCGKFALTETHQHEHMYNLHSELLLFRDQCQGGASTQTQLLILAASVV
jgi:hypothetical protein